ncbi:MAG: glycosyl hydrolase, repeat-containing protein [Bryobacterales bacterium]|nr:glycosyl hydrolase, repeat-containing protein [Bryobacterales bacterium]
MRILTALLLPALCCAQRWIPQPSGVTASLRGVAAVSRKIVWASGSGGTWLRSVDGGATWASGKVRGGEMLDFRAIQAFSARDAIVMSSGGGPLSKIFSTRDGGSSWQLLFDNPDPKGFFDGLAFRDRQHGVLLGDPVGGRFTVFVTNDGGKTWLRREGPATNPGEASFAASNSTVRLVGGDIWIASGGTGGARVFHSRDQGKTWDARQTPIRHDLETAGIFGLTWRSGRYGIAVGGDYKKDQDRSRNSAITVDGGATWTSAEGPAGFRSSVVYNKDLKAWIATGTSGSDISVDGLSWRKFDGAPYNAISGPWAVGPQGAIARLTR